MVHFVRAAQGVDARAREKTLAGCCSLAQERNRIRGQTAGVQNNGGELILPEWQRREVKVEQMLLHRDLLRNEPALQDDGGHGAWLQISINSRELHRDVVRDTYLTATGSAERERQARIARATAMHRVDAPARRPPTGGFSSKPVGWRPRRVHARTSPGARPRRSTMRQRTVTLPEPLLGGGDWALRLRPVHPRPSNELMAGTVLQVLPFCVQLLKSQ